MPKTTQNNPLRLSGDLALSSTGEQERREYQIRFVRAGRVKNQLGEDSIIEIPYDVIKAAHRKGMFMDLAVFVDHHGWFEHPKTQRLVGVSFESWYNENDQSIEGKIRMYDTPLANDVVNLFDSFLEDWEDGESVPNIGFSLVLYPEWKPRDNYDDPLVMKSIRKIESVDFVFSPGADGRLLAQLSAHMATNLEMELQAMPPIIENEELQAPEEQPAQAAQPEEGRQIETWLESVRESAASAILASSGLPAHSQGRLLQLHHASPGDLQAAIEAEREYIASLQAENVVDMGEVPPRSPRIVVGLSGFEELEQAAEALLLGVNPPNDVRPLSGIRELYTLLSGDYEMTGMFQGDRIMFANVTSSTMAGICANALNKAVVNQMAELPKWWAPAVTIVNFNTLHDARWTTLGGVGELPTVAEGESYSEMTWDDQTETDSFIKKGGYLGITLEAIDKDDTRRVQAAPRMLARAAWMTLGKSISAIFTTASGTGPTMSDSNVLFDSSNHGNLLTTALSPSEYKVVKIAMMKQTEINSAERLGGLTAPYLLWVPVDLEDTAIEILASDEQYDYALSNGVSGKINVHADGEGRAARLASARQRVITVPFWTDTNNWAAQANPLLYPSIGLGFRFGQDPEIFSVADPRAGLMFTNDVMPVKVRYFYATGPIDWRGLHKSNVA